MPPDGSKQPRHSAGTELDSRRQVVRFLVVGTFSVAVDLAVYTLLTTITPLNWGASKGLSYAAGVVVGFFGNKFWTFQSTRLSATEPARYLLLYAGTLLLNIGCNHFALVALGSERKIIAFLLATGVTMVTNFFGMKRFAFRRGIAERKRMQQGAGGKRKDSKQPKLGGRHFALRSETADSVNPDT